MATRGAGLIVGVSSVAGERGRSSNYVYGSAKAGLTDYRIIVNVGASAGQTVFHLHWHILGGREMGHSFL